MIRPIYLLADSQLLFWRVQGVLFLETIKQHLPSASLNAAYIGASNGDIAEFFAIFEAAMAGIGIRTCRHISARYTSADADFLDRAHIILLAGGDVARGWSVFHQSEIGSTIVRRYHDGALLIGISAGAIQLGLYGWSDDKVTGDGFFETFQLVPYIIGAHEEGQQWRQLQHVVHSMDNGIQGIGIPSGGGAIYHTDGRLEAIRVPYVCFPADDAVHV